MIIADTGFWVALMNRNDRHHAVAVRKLDEIREPLITTWPVLTETCHILLARLGQHVQQQFITAISHGITHIFELQAEHTERMATLMQKYGDLPMDLADASLVLLAESHGDGRILSTDLRDFGTYRWKHTQPFTNLLLPT